MRGGPGSVQSIASGLALCAALAAALTFAPSVDAQAVDPADEDADDDAAEGEMDVIVVRGQRPADEAQSQAIAISAFGQDQLDQLGVSDFLSLQQNVPSLQIGQAGTRGVVTLRGIGVSNLSLTGEQSVLVVLDGITLGRPSSALQPFFDVRSVQALRGPQGTQGYKHVTGGLLLIESAPPEPELAAFADYQIGSYDQHVWRGYLNLPVLGERLMLRFSSRFEDRDGYQKRIGPRFEGFFPTPAGSYDESDAFDDAHNLLFRAQARSVLRDGLEIRLIGQYSSQQGNGPAIHLLGNPNVSTTTGCAVNLNCIPGVGTRFARTSPDPRRTYSDYPGYRNDWQGFASAQLRWDVEHDALGPLRIDARFGFNRDSVDQAYDSDLTYAAATIVFPTSEARQYSGEVSIRSVDSRPWDWRLGALYWQEQVATDNAVNANGSIPGGDGRILNEIDNRTVSAMGEVDYWLTNTLRLGGGFNWSQDDKEVIARRRGFGAFGLGSVRSQQTFSKPAWKALVDWRWAPASRVVLSASSGFKAGGFPLGAQCDGENICEPFGQEEVVLYELTSKNDFFDERLRLNVTLFWTEYEPFQVCLAAGISFSCASRGDATSRGVEVELSAFPVPELQITGNFNILDARVDRHRLVDPLEIRFPPGDAPLKERENPLNGFAQDLSGNTIERSPKYNLSLLVRYDLELSAVGLPDWGTLSPQIQYQYQTRTYYRIFNIEQNSQGPFSLVNLRLLWRSPSSRWSVEGFVDNATDNDVINFLTVGAGPELRAAYNRPRWAGLRVGFSY